MIDGQLHQECSLEQAWKSMIESWPASFFEN